jgi:hypothetical protein
VTQKENAILLFHLIGKIMYNKRLCASMVPHFTLMQKFTQGRVTLICHLLLQRTSHETVNSIGRWKIRHHYLFGWLRRSDEPVA